VSRTLWLADGNAPDGEDDYTILACIQVRGWLYTLLSYPALDNPPDIMVEARLASGELLPWRAMSGEGASTLDLATMRSFAPPEGTQELFVTGRANDVPLAEARLVRTSPPG
jgi:hypothetical protein